MTTSALPPLCRIVHGSSASVKQPFADLPLTMHELSGGNDIGFRGQLGFIRFTTAIRLPRHVHLSVSDTPEHPRALLAERILVLNGSGLVELAGTLHAVAPGSLVEIGPGVPHSWTACPAGITLPDGSVTDGTFLMIYEYAGPTAFSPTAQTAPLATTADYQPFEGDPDAIRIPALAPNGLRDRAVALTWNGTPTRL